MARRSSRSGKVSKRLSIAKARKIARSLQEEAAKAERGRPSRRAITRAETATGSGAVVFHGVRVLEGYHRAGKKVVRRPAKKRKTD